MHDDIRSILTHARARDLDEMRECGLDVETVIASFAVPWVLGRVFSHEGRPVAVLAFQEITPKALAISMFATDAWPKVARAMVKWALRDAADDLIARGYLRAECRTMAGHEAAIRLLERTGFTLECRLPGFGASGATFLQYAWRLNDHVLLKTQSAAAAPAAADA